MELIIDWEAQRDYSLEKGFKEQLFYKSFGGYKITVEDIKNKFHELGYKKIYFSLPHELRNGDSVLTGFVCEDEGPYKGKFLLPMTQLSEAYHRQLKQHREQNPEMFFRIVPFYLFKDRCKDTLDEMGLTECVEMNLQKEITADALEEDCYGM